jgi:hypothetical protein
MEGWLGSPYDWVTLMLHVLWSWLHKGAMAVGSDTPKCLGLSGVLISLPR